jgi:hypothetical protein
MNSPLPVRSDCAIRFRESVTASEYTVPGSLSDSESEYAGRRWRYRDYHVT